MEKDSSPLDTLRQLKEWLDAGTITPQEFETLKRKLLFSDMPPADATPTPPDNPPTATVVPPSAPTPPSPWVLPPPVPPSAPTTKVPDPTVPPSPVVPPVFSSPASPKAPSAPAAPQFLPPAEPARPQRTVYPAPGSGQEFGASDAALPDERSTPERNPLSTILIIGGIIALLALIGYLMFGNRQSERLTSKSQTAADNVVDKPDVGPQAEQAAPSVAAPETVRVVPAAPPATAPSSRPAPKSDSAAAVVSAPAGRMSTPAAASIDESAVEAQVRDALTSYYEDLKAPPFDAAAHFAPNVERFYTLRNTTPAAINDELASTHFPEFSEAETQGVPGSLHVSGPAADGSRVVTYIEKSRAFRQSRQQHQQTTAQVRVRFDRNFKIVYLRQERLLENVFTD